MADITIESAAHTSAMSMYGRGGVFWTTTLIGYIIYIDANLDLVYRKTTDGGATWAAANALVTGTVYTYDCWADWQTAGDAGTKIHICCTDLDSDDILYISLDTSNDSEFTDTIEVCQGTGAMGGSNVRDAQYCSITKTRGGKIAVAARYRDSTPTYYYIFYESTDGDTWTSRTVPWETALDYLLLFPANLADNQDLWAAFWDIDANEISLKTFDDSANSWAENSIASSMAYNATYLQMDGCIRLSDGHLIFAAWNLYDNAAADLMVWDITDGGTITAKTNVITNESETFLCSVFINQNTDDIYISYTSGTAAQATTSMFYQKSTNGGTNWDGETAMQADAEDDERWVSSGAVKVAWGGKFQPVWFNDDLNGIFCNTDNGVSIAAVGGGGGTVVTSSPVIEVNPYLPVRLLGVNRSSSIGIVLFTSPSRLWNAIVPSTAAITTATSASRVWGATRSSSVVANVITAASSLLSMIRSSATAISLLATPSRLWNAIIPSATTITTAASPSKIWGSVVNASVIINTVATATRAWGAIVTSSPAITLRTLATKGSAFFATSAPIITLTTGASAFLTMVRSSVATINLVATPSRLWNAVVSSALVINVAATASKALTFLRWLHAISRIARQFQLATRIRAKKTGYREDEG